MLPIRPLQKGRCFQRPAGLFWVFLFTCHCFGVEILETEYEGRKHWMIRTSNAVWFYDQSGGGLSRLIDEEGRDWINFGKEPLSEFPASAGAGYRGMPNLVFVGPDKGAGHPGFDRCRSERAPDNVIRSFSLSGKWAWSWRFFEYHAEFTMEKADPDHAWWFLYEGPIAGSFDPAQKYWGTDQGGPRLDLPTNRSQIFDTWRWVYFGDRSVDRVLYLIHQIPDSLPDTMWYLGNADGGSTASKDGMVVYGFGRGPGTKPLLMGEGQTFRVGFLNTRYEQAQEMVRSRVDFLQTQKTGPDNQNPRPKDLKVWQGSNQTFGVFGQTQRWVNVLGAVEPVEELMGLAFSLHQGPWNQLNWGTDLHRLGRSGDFNVELGWNQLTSGANPLRIRALWADGSSETREVELNITQGRTWPLPYEVDFTQTKNLQTEVQIVDGKWVLTGKGVRTAQTWYDRVLSLGDATWTNYQAEVTFTLHGFTPPQRGAPTYGVSHFGIALRWPGHSLDGRQPSRQWYPLGAQGELLLKTNLDECRWRILRGSGEPWPAVYADQPEPVKLNVALVAKAEVFNRSDGFSVYRFKHWVKGEHEPDNWFVEATKPVEEDVAAGSLCLVAHHSDATIHSVRVNPALPNP